MIMIPRNPFAIRKKAPACRPLKQVNIETGKQQQTPWNDHIKVQAAFLLRDKILDQLRVVQELDTLLAHAKLSLEARVITAQQQSFNKVSAMIFIKVILKYEAQRAAALKKIADFRALAMEIRYSDTPIDYEVRIHVILADLFRNHEDTSENEDKDHVLYEIQKRLTNANVPVGLDQQ
jgi:hypothetical protein